MRLQNKPELTTLIDYIRISLADIYTIGLEVDDEANREVSSDNENILNVDILADD
jgi:hypothetical protein